MEEISEELIEKLRRGSNSDFLQIGRGANSVCFAIDDENVILVSRFNKSIFEKHMKLMERTQKLESEGVNIGTVKDVKVADDQIYTLQKRVPGKNLYNRFYSDSMHPGASDSMKNFRTNEESKLLMIQAPQSHFDKYLLDIIAIRNGGLHQDFRNTENVMYDENLGFYFIDLDVVYYRNETPKDLINYDFLNSQVFVPIMNEYRIQWKDSEYVEVYEKLIQAIIKMAKESNGIQLISLKTVEELIDRVKEIEKDRDNSFSDDLKDGLEELKKDTEQKERKNKIIEFRKRIMEIIRKARIEYKETEWVWLLSDRGNTDLKNLCLQLGLNWENEKEKLDFVDKVIQSYLTENDETRKQEMEKKVRAACEKLDLDFDEQLQQTQNANEKAEQERINRINAFRKNTMDVIRRARKEYKGGNWRNFLVISNNLELRVICEEEKLNWQEESEKLEILDKTIQCYLAENDELPKQEMEKKARMACEKLDLDFDEQVQRTIDANLRDEEEWGK